MRLSIGIMSMQRIANYGSSLQAYGLKRIVEELVSGSEVTFLDFVPGDPLTGHQAPADATARRTYAKIREYAKVDGTLSNRLRFFDHKWAYSRRHLPPLGIPREPNYSSAVDVQIIGSDEVFNCVQANAKVGYSRDLFAHGSTARRVISYAASFGNTSLASIEEAGIGDDLRQAFSRFSAISVRDDNSAAIVEALTGTRPEIHVDPVLAWDFMNQEHGIPSGRQYQRRYLVAYGYGGRFSDEENDAVTRYARSKGLDVICLGGVQGCCDRFVDSSPFEVLALFRDAEAVVTDTFHGTIFAILNRRPFATLIRPTVHGGYGNEEKVGSLLDLFGLQAQKVGATLDLNATLESRVDFSQVFDEINVQRRRTREYLGRQIVEETAA